jgi:hypothetical protein
VYLSVSVNVTSAFLDPLCNEVSRCTRRVHAMCSTVKVNPPRSVKCTAFKATYCTTVPAKSTKAFYIDIVVVSLFIRQNYLLVCHHSCFDRTFTCL